jgi:hypothetical protein
VTANPDELDFEPMRIAMSLLLADLDGDAERAGLIIATTDDPWPVLRWTLTALHGWIVQAGYDPAQYARGVIAATVSDEAEDP